MDKKTQQNLLNIVQRNYDEIAYSFAKTRKKNLWPELINLINNVKNNTKILDLGCGNGRLLEILQNKKIKYVGIDNNEKLIKIAKKKYDALAIKPKFIKGNFLELDKIKESDFDYIFCVAAFHHVPGKNLQIKFLRQIKNKIKKDGEIIITVWNLWSQKKFRKLILKYALQKLTLKNKLDFGDILFKGFKENSERYYHAFRAKELQNIVKNSGLKIKKLYKDKYNYYLIGTQTNNK